MEHLAEAQLQLQVAVGLIILLPIYYDFRSRVLSKKAIQPQSQEGFKEFVTVKIILPMRNEATNALSIIPAILDEIISKEFCSVLIIDSNSSDNTGKIAEQILQESKLDTNRWEVIYAERPGKSHCINLALDRSDSDIYIMLDSDIRPHKGWFAKIIEAISDQDIAVVSGTESTRKESRNTMNEIYKSYSNKTRLRHSSIDSSPILEGGLFCWKSICFGDYRLNETSNADDAQLVFRALRNGYRTVAVPGLVFEDLGGEMGSFNRLIRRSQGLSRVLISNLDLFFRLPRKAAKIPVKSVISLYLFLPWAFFLFFLNSVTAMIFWNHDYLSWPFLSLISFVILLTHPIGRSVVHGASITILSQILFIFGFNFSSWDTHRHSDLH